MKQEFSRVPPRLYVDNSIYFITFVTYERRPLLHKKQIPDFLKLEFTFYKEKYLKDLIAFAILPDHIHLLVEIEKAENISRFLMAFKRFISIKIRDFLRLDPGPVWQRGTMDHVIRDEDDYNGHLNYIFWNSQKHLNMAPKHYPHHNFKDFVKNGYYSLDWGNYGNY